MDPEEALAGGHFSVAAVVAALDSVVHVVAMAAVKEMSEKLLAVHDELASLADDSDVV